jgi:hypothetical protein
MLSLVALIVHVAYKLTRCALVEPGACEGQKSVCENQGSA